VLGLILQSMLKLSFGLLISLAKQLGVLVMIHDVCSVSGKLRGAQFISDGDLFGVLLHDRSCQNQR
jgi:hypothetical protein